MNTLPTFERRVIRALPAPFRLRASMRVVRGLVRSTYPGSRAIVKVKRGNATVDLRGSLFCEVRETSVLPLCGFYAAATGRVLQLCAIAAEARVAECRAAGGRKGCMMLVEVAPAPAGEPAAA
jgi:hypothetical protein